MRRKRKKRDSESVELNLAAMLDMAFQLLTFFILTFRPAPIEGQLVLQLPPPLPVTDVETQQQEQTGSGGGEAGLKSLIITVDADSGGNVSSLKVGFGMLFKGPANESNLHKLDQRLRDAFTLYAGSFEQVLIRAAPALHYGELMRIVDVCMQQKLADGTNLQKVSFAELAE